MAINYKKIYAVKAEREKRIAAICPGIPNTSGIYIFYRKDDAGIRRGYCGQAKHLKERCAAHLGEYDHLALSLKKHGFYSENNPTGWKLQFKTCDVEEMDEKEIATIKACADSGMQMYNVSLGGQGENRSSGQINERQPSKGYRDGIAQGRKNLARELKDIIDKHLIVAIKPEKANNKVSQKQFEKFKDLLEQEGKDEH